MLFAVNSNLFMILTSNSLSIRNMLSLKPKKSHLKVQMLQIPVNSLQSIKGISEDHLSYMVQGKRKWQASIFDRTALQKIYIIASYIWQVKNFVQEEALSHSFFSNNSNKTYIACRIFFHQLWKLWPNFKDIRYLINIDNLNYGGNFVVLVFNV